ncbi:protein broad-minded isoform X1 [Gadus morhua]|uniref:protein broad-minded isoform X1 n=1 Tax=Gadus morhua TaxID=8049 RepID=UPI0011B35C11|nr:protein broad-minded isoform X1 [Gadus morhua]XP_030201531.1 protein broad-minded isoform X1 [Gadus morhua]
MSQFSSEDEAELQYLLRQLLKSTKDRISGAPSIECAEEILLHLEETDKKFHNYELVRYLRQHVDRSLGALVEAETELGAGGDAGASAHDIHAVTRRTRDSAEYKQMMQTLKNTMSLVVESLINKFEEDQLRKEETYRDNLPGASEGRFNDNCSDSDSSFNHSYAFIKQEQLQALAEQLDSSQPKEVRWEALQKLCCAPPSDVLSCETWNSLRTSLSAVLDDRDPDLSDKVLKFFAKTSSSSPFNLTREIYSSLAKSLEGYFLSHKLSLPIGSDGIDVTRPDISRLLKQMRLINDFQKEMPSFWIRHPEKYMEEVIESTFSLLSVHPDLGLASPGTEKALEPVYLLALLDIKATWFNKWMHSYYSRAVIFRLLERKYKSLIVAAVQQCLQHLSDCEHRSPQTSGSSAEPQTSSSQWSIYTRSELEYAFFVHSLCVLGKVLIYTNGRKLFPIKIRKHKDLYSLTDLVVTLINIMYQHPQPPRTDPSHTVSLAPRSLVTELLWMLCEQTESAAECIYQSPVIETLLAPLIRLLNGEQAKLKSPAGSLTHIADVLARIASTDRGLALFLNDKSLDLSSSKGLSASHIIVQFTQRLLDKDLPSLGRWEMSPAVCGAFLFACRQMYNTCEGLQILRPYGLHSCIAAALKEVPRVLLLTQCSNTSTIPVSKNRTPSANAVSTPASTPASTPIPGHSSSTCSLETIAGPSLIWEETLQDSLLHFAATPKGLLLLQSTGALDHCVAYMYSRFIKKLQVSRCEKFGYGVMVTQVAATAPGVMALLNSGYVQELVVKLWSVLECGREDLRVVHPKSTPMDPIDRSCLKSFLALVNLLSSGASVWALLRGQPLPQREAYPLREVPSTIADLMDRLIAVDSDAKINSLFNYEQSHTFGLRLLCVLCCDLDSFLLLESQYALCSMLLLRQKENVTEPAEAQGQLILDRLSVERNHLLVRVCAVGGPSERRLPPRALQEGPDPYPWPMFLSYPSAPPQCYTLDAAMLPQSKQDSEISAFLASGIPAKDEGWMAACRKQYCKDMSTTPSSLTGSVLSQLLEKVVSVNAATQPFFPPAHYKAKDSSVKRVELSAVQLLGMNICVRYGRSLGLLKDEGTEELALLLKHSHLFLAAQRATTHPTAVPDLHPGQDWLAATLFLMMAGDGERARRWLVDFSSLLCSAFLWPARMHSSVHLPAPVAASGIPPVYWCTAHYVEMLLKAEVPLVHSAFRMSGFTPSQICLQWLNQCFWNYLDWPEVCHYVSTCVLMGPDYQVYVCVAVLKHMQPDILLHTQAQDLQVYLKEEPILGFRFQDHLEFMEQLEGKYGTTVLTDMQRITTPAA